MKTQLSEPKPKPRAKKSFGIYGKLKSQLRKSNSRSKAESEFGICKEHNREIELRKLIVAGSVDNFLSMFL